jgi:hypothetical protein
MTSHGIRTQGSGPPHEVVNVAFLGSHTISKSKPWVEIRVRIPIPSLRERPAILGNR